MCRVRQPANCPSDMPEINWSPTQISPWLGVSSPAIRFSSVVLPDPLGPINPKNCPSGTPSVTPLSTSTRSLPRRKNLWTPLNANDVHGFMNATIAPMSGFR